MAEEGPLFDPPSYEGPTISAPRPRHAAREGQEAGSAVQHCPALQHKRPPRDSDTPCDLRQITAQLTTGAGAITVHNTRREATEEPLLGLSARETELLETFSVVIVEVLGMGAEGTGAASGHEPQSEMNTLTRRAQASAHISMKAQCGVHPLWAEKTPEGKWSRAPTHSTQGKSTELKLSAEEVTFSGLLKQLWGGKLGELFRPAEAYCIFDFWSCGLPAKGDAFGEAAAYVGLKSLDDWVISYRWPSGAQFKFGHTTMQLKDLRDGARVGQTTDTVSGGAAGKYASIESKTATVSKDGSGALYKPPKGEAQEDEDDKGTLEHSARRSHEGAADKVGEQFDKVGDEVKKISQGHGMALQVTRNGAAMLDSDELAETIEKVKSFIESLVDLIRRVNLIVQTACKLGIPVSVTYGFDLGITVLRGTLNLHRYEEALPALQGGAYHLGRSHHHWAFHVEFKPMAGDFTASIEFMAKVIHAAVASVSVKIEFKWKGDVGIQLSLDDATRSGAFRAGGSMFCSVKGTGEAAAATFYIQVTATASSGIEYAWRAQFDGTNLHVLRNHVVTHKVAVQASMRYGNKIWDFFGLGSDAPDWQWPKDGPFVVIEEGAIDEDLREFVFS